MAPERRIHGCCAVCTIKFFLLRTEDESGHERRAGGVLNYFHNDDATILLLILVCFLQTTIQFTYSTNLTLKEPVFSYPVPLASEYLTLEPYILRKRYVNSKDIHRETSPSFIGTVITTSKPLFADTRSLRTARCRLLDV